MLRITASAHVPVRLLPAWELHVTHITHTQMDISRTHPIHYGPLQYFNINIIRDGDGDGDGRRLWSGFPCGFIVHWTILLILFFFSS